MKYLKKLMIIFILIFCIMLSSCANSGNDVQVLRVYNWQDYIDEGLDEDGEKVAPSVLEDWKEWYEDKYNTKVDFIYDTFETNEVMLNTLKTGKTSYDLICPSDYAIQKMIRLDMLEKIDYDLVDANGDLVMENYKCVSKYLKDLFETKSFNDYAVPYMWGTMGFIYNPTMFDSKEDESKVNHWSILWDKDYKKMASAKDSVRDTYVVGVMNVYYDELMILKDRYENHLIDEETYNQSVGKIMNRCDDYTLEKVQEALFEMKENLYGFEVDSGKSDIVTGKVSLNFAWSGDAVYSMDVAEEEEDIYLNYVVPEEGSNVWFDGWVMQKGANKLLAQSFIDFCCRPEIAVRNMNTIGYTSSVVGEEILEMITDWYGPSEPYYDEELGFFVYEDQSFSDLTDSSLEVTVKDGFYYIGSFNTEIEENTSEEADLTYLFEGSIEEDSPYFQDGKIIVSVAERGRQFDCQYPSFETIARCGIMEDFGDRNDAVLEMWESVKIGDIPLSITYITIGVIILAILSFYLYNKKKEYLVKQRNKFDEA